jgi:prolipoprotein diacylglyceryl transferase
VTVAVTDAASYLAAIPSPTQGVWYLGPFPVRAYALCILLGMVAAAWIAEVRLRHRGAPKWLVLDVTVWAVPFGIIGGRIYHVITSPDAYFGTGGNPMKVFAIWEGGLGIWGAIALGGVGAWIGCRRLGIPLTFFADALAPGLVVAQAIGRLGNWFNNELYGSHTGLPWGLTVYQYDLSTGKAETDAAGDPIVVAGGPFHPAFLYELVWNLGVALMVYLVDRRLKLGKGRAFALYVMGYTVGRFWIEALRTDPAHHFLGMRLNNWVAIAVFLGALLYFMRVRGPQEHVRLDEAGKLQLVTADGTPIDWKAPEAAVTGIGGSRPDVPPGAVTSDQDSGDADPPRHAVPGAEVVDDTTDGDVGDAAPADVGDAAPADKK